MFTRRNLGFLFAIATSVVTVTAISACKQGEGERCQLDQDCGDGLICSLGAPHVCRVPTPEVTIDAGVADAPFDARPVDAAIDVQ